MNEEENMSKKRMEEPEGCRACERKISYCPHHCAHLGDRIKFLNQDKTYVPENAEASGEAVPMQGDY